MIGNVWEWTTGWLAQPKTPNKKFRGACRVPANPGGEQERDSYDPATPRVRIGRRVLKGGWHLCAASYCRRYRPAVRHARSIDSATSHIGFRCVRGEG